MMRWYWKVGIEICFSSLVAVGVGFDEVVVMHKWDEEKRGGLYPGVSGA